MSHLSVVYYSGYGHTVNVAQAIVDGISQENVQVHLIAIDAEGELTEGDWFKLNESAGIVFGAPTYMGGPAWQFKKFADASSKPWYSRIWQDKLAGGFTNSASMVGDKGATLSYLSTLASQHGMLWVSLGQLPANSKAADRNDPNYLGGSVGVLAQSPSDSSPEEGPLPGDLATAKLYGTRFAQLAKKFNLV